MRISIYGTFLHSSDGLGAAIGIALAYGSCICLKHFEQSLAIQSLVRKRDGHARQAVSIFAA